MAEYKQEWELEIEEIFLSDDLEEIVDGTRSFFQEMKLGASQEQEKIWHWLACAYRHKEVSRTPFFPILFLYAVCENEEFTEEKITRYLGYAVRYIYVKSREFQNNPQGKESELRNGWLKRHMDQLPQEHQKVARIYLEIVDYLFPEDEMGVEDNNHWSDEEDGEQGYENDQDDYLDENENFMPDSENGASSLDKRSRKQKKGSSKKGLLIGLVAGLLIGITLGCTGTALVLNGYLEKDKQTDVSQTDSSRPNSSLPENSSPDTSSSDLARPDESGLNGSKPDEPGLNGSKPDESGLNGSKPDESGPNRSESDESGSNRSESDASGSNTPGSDESEPGTSSSALPPESTPSDTSSDSVAGGGREAGGNSQM